MVGANVSDLERWPALPWEEWEDTCDTLHLWTQVVGKIKLKLCPFLNELWHVALHPTPRGLSTGRIPFGAGAFSITFDFVDHQLLVVTSDGQARAIALGARSVADFYRALMNALRDLGIDVAINLVPDEITDPIRLDQDEVHASYDPIFVRRWWHITLQTTLILDRYRSSFFGKSSPVLFWWGSFDLSTTRFSGRPAPPLSGVPRFMRLAEDQENFVAGFWPGNTTASGVSVGEPCFFSYIYPEPAGLKDVPVSPQIARYDTRLGLHILPYHEIRGTAAPEQAILDFFTSGYEAAAALAQWDRVLTPRAP